MILTSLGLENWACHGRLDIDLSAGLQIEGRNGAGKSSVLEAIRFMFSKDARRYKGKIKNGKKTARVRLEFDKDGNSYRVERALHLSKSSSASLAINGSMVADNPTTVYNSLQACMDERVMDKLLYVPQGGLTELVDRLTLKGGRQELDSLLGLDRFEQVYEGSSKEFAEKKALYDLLHKEFIKYPETLEEKSLKDIGELDSEIAGLTDKKSADERELGGMSKRIKELDEEIERLRKVRKSREVLGERINKLRLEVVRQDSEISGLRKDLEHIEGRKKGISSLRDKERVLEKYEVIRKLLSELESSKERLVDKDRIDKDREKLKNLEEILQGKETSRSKLEKAKERVMELERVLAANMQRRKESEGYLKGLEGLDDKARCPRCGRPLTEKHLAIEKKLARDGIREVNIDIGGVENKLRDETKAKNSLEKRLEFIRKSEVEADCLEKDLSARENENDRILARMEEIKGRLGDSGYSGESPSAVDSRIAELNSTRGEIKTLQAEIERGRDVAKKLSSIEKGSLEAKSSLKNSEDEFNGLEFREGVFNALEEERNDLNDRMYKRKGEIESKELRIKEIRKGVDELERLLQEFTELKGSLEKAEREMGLFREARDEVFHPNRGIRRYYRELYMKRLSALLTYYFRRINQNPKYKEVVFDRDYRIRIHSNEGEFSMEQLSGGERVQLALALRISLIELLSPVRLLILDEPFGSLDREHREVLGEALNRTAKDGQLILVTHIHVDSLNLPEKLELGSY